MFKDVSQCKENVNFIREGEHAFEKDETYSGKFIDDNNEFNYVFYQEVGH